MGRLKLISSITVTCTILGGLLLGQYWRTQLHQVPLTHDQQPDVFANQVKSQQYNDNGDLIRQFDADFLLVFEKEETANAKQPLLTATLDNGQPIQIRAHHGDMLSRDQVQLKQNVRIDTRLQADLPVTITSATMRYGISEQIAQTEAEVNITSPNRFQLSSTGLTANFKTEQVQLHQRVRGIYEPATN